MGVERTGVVGVVVRTGVAGVVVLAGVAGLVVCAGAAGLVVARTGVVGLVVARAGAAGLVVERTGAEPGFCAAFGVGLVAGCLAGDAACLSGIVFAPGFAGSAFLCGVGVGFGVGVGLVAGVALGGTATCGLVGTARGAGLTGVGSGRERKNLPVCGLIIVGYTA